MLLLPALVLWHRDSVLYSPPMHTDPWFYLGYFRTLVDFQRDLFPGFHAGTRYSWILPGWLVHSLLPPVAANFVLHLTVHSVAVLSLFFILRAVSGVRAAFLSAMLFSLHPWLWAATGWDYVDGPGIAYCLLTLALLTRAARSRPGKVILALAGVALAAMLYTNLSWTTVAPLLPLYYVAMVAARQPSGVLRPLLIELLWLCGGFAIVTAIFAVVNYWLAGSFWFLGPAISTARNYGANWRWPAGIWRDGLLGPWLWFSVGASATAILLLPIRLGRGAVRKCVPELLFSGLLFFTLGTMAYMQYRGVTVLGPYFYASHLLPFVFLVIGSSYFQAASDMTPRAYLATCCIGCAVFAAMWYEPERWALNELATIVAAASVLAIALALRRRKAGVAFALGGFVLLTCGMASEAAGLHGTRAQYERVMDGRGRIEKIRHGNPVWFWFDEHDPYLADYFALNSTYLAEARRLNSAFPQYGCEVKLEAGTLVVVSSANEHAPDAALGPLEKCWRPYGMKAVVEEVDRYQPDSHGYTVGLIRAHADAALRHPLRAVFDSSAKGRLEVATDSSTPIAFPADRWTGFTYPSDNGRVQTTAQGIEVRTPRRAYASVLTYGPLVAPVTGRYRFALEYSHRHGQFAFGARDVGDTRYLGEDANGQRSGDIREMAFWVDLQAGETFLLRIANNNNSGGGAASFRLEKLSALEVDP